MLKLPQLIKVAALSLPLAQASLPSVSSAAEKAAADTGTKVIIKLRATDSPAAVTNQNVTVTNIPYHSARSALLQSNALESITNAIYNNRYRRQLPKRQLRNLLMAPASKINPWLDDVASTQPLSTVYATLLGLREKGIRIDDLKNYLDPQTANLLVLSQAMTTVTSLELDGLTKADAWRGAYTNNTRNEQVLILGLNRLMKNGYLEEASRLTEFALTQNPNIPQFLLVAGDLQSLSGNVAAAAAFWGRLITSATNSLAGVVEREALARLLSHPALAQAVDREKWLAAMLHQPKSELVNKHIFALLSRFRVGDLEDFIVTAVLNPQISVEEKLLAVAAMAHSGYGLSRVTLHHLLRDALKDNKIHSSELSPATLFAALQVLDPLATLDISLTLLAENRGATAPSGIEQKSIDHLAALNKLGFLSVNDQFVATSLQGNLGRSLDLTYQLIKDENSVAGVLATLERHHDTLRRSMSLKHRTNIAKLVRRLHQQGWLVIDPLRRSFSGGFVHKLQHTENSATRAPQTDADMLRAIERLGTATNTALVTAVSSSLQVHTGTERWKAYQQLGAAPHTLMARELLFPADTNSVAIYKEVLRPQGMTNSQNDIVVFGQIPQRIRALMAQNPTLLDKTEISFARRELRFAFERPWQVLTPLDAIMLAADIAQQKGYEGYSTEQFLKALLFEAAQRYPRFDRLATKRSDKEPLDTQAIVARGHHWIKSASEWAAAYEMARVEVVRNRLISAMPKVVWTDINNERGMINGIDTSSGMAVTPNYEREALLRESEALLKKYRGKVSKYGEGNWDWMSKLTTNTPVQAQWAFDPRINVLMAEYIFTIDKKSRSVFFTVTNADHVLPRIYAALQELPGAPQQVDLLGMARRESKNIALQIEALGRRFIGPDAEYRMQLLHGDYHVHDPIITAPPPEPMLQIKYIQQMYRKWQAGCADMRVDAHEAIASMNKSRKQEDNWSIGFSYGFSGGISTYMGTFSRNGMGVSMQFGPTTGMGFSVDIGPIQLGSHHLQELRPK